MSQEFDAFEYAGHLGSRWRAIAGGCVVALLLTAAITFFLPKRYTATASILIDPPAGSDPRTTTAVSPIYLESLKSYEHFAASDTVFQKASEKFHLTESGASNEGLKRRILRVAKVRDTKILEIAVTLDSPQTAQALAQYLAEETIHLSQALLRDGEADLLQEARQQMDDAKARFDAGQKAWSAFASASSIEGLRTELESAATLRSRIRREFIQASARAADLASRPKNADPEDGIARVATLEKQLRELDREWTAKNSLLATQQTRETQLMTELETAKKALDITTNKFREVQSATGYRGERLKLIDPGVVPQRPSSPNLMLNLLAALLVAFTAAIVFVSFEFVWQRHRLQTPRNRPLPIDR